MLSDECQEERAKVNKNIYIDEFVYSLIVLFPFLLLDYCS